jgi:hypothetical protein
MTTADEYMHDRIPAVDLRNALNSMQGNYNLDAI